jgi:hypothetical protein
MQRTVCLVTTTIVLSCAAAACSKEDTPLGDGGAIAEVPPEWACLAHPTEVVSRDPHDVTT